MADSSQGDAMLLQHIAADEGILAIIEGQVTQARSAVLKAERDLAIARALLDDSLAKRLAFQQSMKRKRAVLTVLPSFPTELLYAVFERVVEMERKDILATSILHRKRSQEPRSDPFGYPSPEPYRRFPRPSVLALAAVCQRWRDASLAHPPLWALLTLWCGGSTIGSHLSVSHLHRCLERSRGVPLNVLHFDSCGSCCVDCTGPSYAQAVQNIYMHCGELSIEFRPLIYIPRNHPLHLPTPQLRRCTVCERGTRPPPPPLDNLNHQQSASIHWLPQAQRLESFSAHPCPIRSTTFAIQTCAQLTTLRLEDDHIVSTRQLAMFGTYWPKLQHLAIRACEFQGPSSVPAVLPSLVALHLGQKAMPVLSFLHREHIPALEYLAMPCTVQAITTFVTFLDAQPYESLTELHLCGAEWQTAPMHALPWPSGEDITAYMQFLPNVRVLRCSEVQFGEDLLTDWARGGLSHSNDVLNTIVLRGCFLDGITASHVMRSLAMDENFLLSDALVIVKRDPSRDASWYEMIADSKLTKFSSWTRPDSYLIESQYRKL